MYTLTYHSNDDTIGLSMPAKPKEGERTGAQSDVRQSTDRMSGTMVSVEGVGAFPIANSGTFDEYEKILTQPTVVEVRGIVLSAVITNKWELQKKDDAKQEWLDFISEQPQFVEGLSELIRDGTRSLDYGFAPFEKVYGKKGNRISSG
jgi:hypothetical protein